MRKEMKKGIIGLSIVTVFLFVQVLFMMHLINSNQGNARVVNYAGIVRGATQRLVKNELYGKECDDQIERLDDILLGLQTGGGTQRLNVLEDVNYQTKLSLLAEKWEEIKDAIQAARQDQDKRDDLYELSEIYFTMADETVSAAETYSDGITSKMNMLETTILITMFIIVGTFFVGFISEIKHNSRLKKIAYIDPQTGLANKRSCEEKMNDITMIDPDENICCIMFDLNNLKLTNDTLGHEAGDALICTFASILRRTMPEDMFVGRLGGDEFIGIQKNADKMEILNRIVQMRENMGNGNLCPGEQLNAVHISFACGYAFSQEQKNACNIKTLMNIADKNMYLDKKKIKEKIDF